MTRRTTRSHPFSPVGLTALAATGMLVLTACSGRIQTNQNQPAPSAGGTAGNRRDDRPGHHARRGG